MPAVVFGPDRVIGRGRPRTALVLGAGGVLGAAWMTGALVRLHERLPAADVDLLVGTSAGSVLAAALRCRASLDEIVAWQAGDITGQAERIHGARRAGRAAAAVAATAPRIAVAGARGAASPGTALGGGERLAAARPGAA